MQRRHAAILLSLSLVALPGAARAQMISPMLYEGPRIALESHANRSSSSKGEPRAPAQPAVNPAALRYTPSKTRRSANLAAFVQKMRARDPKGADDLQKVFAEGDFIERIDGLVASQGLRVDDVADAYALWWITAWHAARGNNDTPPPQMISAVQAQAARAVLATGEIATASDAHKQALAEALWVQSVLVDTAVEQAKQDPARLRAIGEAVRQAARGMGLDLDAIELTARGFVPAD
jgi:hypothetical protein